MASRNIEKIPPHVVSALRQLGSEIHRTRKSKKLSAQTLAEQANITRPTLKRLESGEPGVTIGLYATVLSILGMTDCLTTLLSPVAQVATAARNEHRSLVWANPQADDSTFIRAALQKPKMIVLADIARDYGFARLEQEWLALKKTPLGQRVAPDVKRMLGHLRQSHAGR